MRNLLTTTLTNCSLFFFSKCIRFCFFFSFSTLQLKDLFGITLNSWVWYIVTHWSLWSTSFFFIFFFFLSFSWLKIVLIIDLEIDQIFELKLLHHQSKKLLLRMCEVLPGLNFRQLRNGKVIEAMIEAVKQGGVEFVTEILKACPDLVWCVEKSTDRHIFIYLCKEKYNGIRHNIYPSLYLFIYFNIISMMSCFQFSYD